MDPWDIVQAAGSAIFIACLVPQFVRTLKIGRANDVSVGFLVLVLAGSALLVPYAAQSEQWYLAVAYVGNLVVWGTVLYFRLRPRSEGRRDLPRRLKGDE